MNICYISCSKKLGGIEKLLIDIANELSFKYKIMVIIPLGCEYKEWFLSEVMVMEYKSYDKRYNIFLYYEIYKIIKHFKPIIIHTHGSKATQIFYRINKLLNLIHIGTKHNIRKGKIFNKLKYVTAVSKDVAETIINKNIKIIFNGIKFKNIEKDIEPNHNFKITAIGRLDKIKGFDILIKEFSKIKNNAILEIIGEGSEFNNLSNLIQQLNIEKKVKLIGFKKNIPEILSQTDLVVISSLSEGFSLVAIEALFYSPVLISTKVGISKEILSDNFIIDNFEISKMIDNIIDNYIEHVEKFKNLKNEHKNKFFLEKMINEYSEYYDKILKEEKNSDFK